MTEQTATRLVVATAAHFDWAMRAVESEPFDGALRLPPGGLDARVVLAWIQQSSSVVSAVTGHAAAWLMVSGDEAVGVISFKGAPHAGAVEIGYGVAESHRGCGHATHAVALVVAEAASHGLDVLAETAAENRASQVVLERNAFRRCGERVDLDGTAILLWRRDR